MTSLDIWNGNLWRSIKPKSEIRLNIVKEALALISKAQPRVVFHYSNADYVIAGAIAERAAGEPWDELIVHELFEPLGMASSGFGAPGIASKLDQPWGHYEGRSRVVPVEPGLAADSPPALGPAGTIHASLGDVRRYLSAHLLGARGRGWLMAPETFAQMHRSRRGEDYALGWVVVASPLAGGLALTRQQFKLVLGRLGHASAQYRIIYRHQSGRRIRVSRRRRSGRRDYAICRGDHPRRCSLNPEPIPQRQQSLRPRSEYPAHRAPEPPSRSPKPASRPRKV